MRMRVHPDFLDAPDKCELIMPIRLDEVPGPAPRPEPLGGWRWLALLALLLLLGTALRSWTAPSSGSSYAFWGPALLPPLLLWAVLGLIRIVLFVGQQGAADGWDESREQDLMQRMAQGRRSQQILGVSLHTALSASYASADLQVSALLKGERQLKSQPTRCGGIARHSRLPGEQAEAPEDVLRRAFAQVMADLAPTLSHLPDDRPLALVLAVNTGVSDEQVWAIFHEQWRTSGICQSPSPINGAGLTLIDQWLDERINDAGSLVVIALQAAHLQPESTAEAAVGLVFGNRLTPCSVSPIAYLHRPQQAHGLDTGALFTSVRQALEWAAIDEQAIRQVWQAGIEQTHVAAVTCATFQAFASVGAPNVTGDLDTLLGQAGPVSPWLAIAAATLNMRGSTQPQFVFAEGGGAAPGLWSMVLTPASALSS